MGHIWLIGMMGSGKSTVGEMAAEILERPFVDTDSAVVAATGRTIPDLFDESEALFRETESLVIAEASAYRSSVIASGGGAILSADNVNVMTATGTIVLLDVDAKSVVERLSGDLNRPLLTEESDVYRVLNQRNNIYRAVAQQVIPTVGRTPTEIAGEIATCADM
jgi:shikimate kinase